MYVSRTAYQINGQIVNFFQEKKSSYSIYDIKIYLRYEKLLVY